MNANWEFDSWVDAIRYRVAQMLKRQMEKG
jgi:hypothetical protein